MAAAAQRSPRPALQRGDVSATARRQATVLLLLLALAWRAWALLSGDPPPGPSGAWLAPALECLLGLGIVRELYREGGHRFGFRAGVLAGGLAAVAAVLLARWPGGPGPVPACSLPLSSTSAGLLLAWLSLDYTLRLVRFGARRERSGVLALGAVAGLLGGLHLAGIAWVLLTLLWLPTRSRHFRGLSGLATLSLFLLAALVVGGGLLALAAWAQGGTLPAPLADARGIAASFARQGIGPALAETLDGLRAFAAHGGWWQRPEAGPPALGLASLALLAWLGAAGLLLSLGSYLPWYLAALLPALAAALPGSREHAGDERALVAMAAPALALLAGYGLSRLWEGRRHPGSWLLAVAALAVGWWWAA